MRRYMDISNNSMNIIIIWASFVTWAPFHSGLYLAHLADLNYLSCQKEDLGPVCFRL
jgi:hypothetical protein